MMTKCNNSVGVCVPELLLPAKGVDMQKWAVVACDQYTSQPDYWNEVESIVGESPSTLRLMLPEIYLGAAGEEERISAINAHMRGYMDEGILESRGRGFVFVKRHAGGKTRMGLVLALDLEHYDYSKGASSLIRATEGTIVERIPPRLRIRKDAPIETPHILVLIDDPDRTVIEPVSYSLDQAEKLYDFELMQHGGRLEGYLINGEAQISAALRALEALADPIAFANAYGPDRPVMLFAMGDGNHSFATAKANWENCKVGLTPDEMEDHPQRYALVELENVHDAGIEFEPIHRVMFTGDSDGALKFLECELSRVNHGCERHIFSERAACDAALAAAQGRGGHVLPFITAAGRGFLYIPTPQAQLEVGTLQSAVDALVASDPSVNVDYIHGADVVERLGAKPGNIGFLLPPMEKSALFRTVVLDGALPRKTFSMGEANEKRYYLECRKITK